ncbi:MAG: hypothetical protein JWN69_366 [Alphaproteobacteria bacterium]|nr:hypothetical protein [Alphaproteobacteria bacterium]
MRASLFLLLLVIVGTPVAAETNSLGVFGFWGAFEKDSPKGCYAITAPHLVSGRQPAAAVAPGFATVAYWPERKIRAQVHFRLSREKRKESAVLLRIDDRTFQLVAGGSDAWAPEPAADAVIVAAMRSGVTMTVETRSATGALVRDSYQLRGAPTAIDAAAVACSR